MPGTMVFCTGANRTVGSWAMLASHFRETRRARLLHAKNSFGLLSFCDKNRSWLLSLALRKGRFTMLKKHDTGLWVLIIQTNLKCMAWFYKQKSVVRNLWPKIFNVFSTGHFYPNSSWCSDSRIWLRKACLVEDDVIGTGLFWAACCSITVRKYIRNNVHYVCVHYIVVRYCRPFLPYISTLPPGNDFWHKHRCRGDKYRCAPTGPCFSTGVLRDTHWPKSNATECHNCWGPQRLQRVFWVVHLKDSCCLTTRMGYACILLSRRKVMWRVFHQLVQSAMMVLVYGSFPRRPSFDREIWTSSRGTSLGLLGY